MADRAELLRRKAVLERRYHRLAYRAGLSDRARAASAGRMRRVAAEHAEVVAKLEAA